MVDENPHSAAIRPDDLELDRRHLLALGAATAIGTGLGPITAAAADDNGGKADEAAEAGGLFLAAMTADQQPDAVDASAAGGTVFSLSEDGTELEYALLVSAVENVNQAHIHLGAEGEEGPVAVWLYPDPGATEPELREGRFDGILATGAITEAHIAESVEGRTMDALIQQITAGNAYVNVHTEEYPGGVMRGQIAAVEDGAAAPVNGDGGGEASDESAEPAESPNDGGDGGY